MSFALDVFLRERGNDTGEYRPFRTVRAYLLERARCLDDRDAFNALAAAGGYRNRTKLRRRIAEWSTLGNAKVPQLFLDAIGATAAELADVLRFDIAAFDRALATLSPPTRFTERLVATVYRSIDLPPGLTEAEAIEVVADHARSTGRKCNIDWPGLRIISFREDGMYADGIAPPNIRRAANGTATFLLGNRRASFEAVGVTRVR